MSKFSYAWSWNYFLTQLDLHKFLSKYFSSYWTPNAKSRSVRKVWNYYLIVWRTIFTLEYVYVRVSLNRSTVLEACHLQSYYLFLMINPCPVNLSTYLEDAFFSKYFPNQILALDRKGTNKTMLVLCVSKVMFHVKSQVSINIDYII